MRNAALVLIMVTLSASQKGLQREVDFPLKCALEYQVQPGDTVTVHYKGLLLDGTVFDSSEDKEPLSFVMGQGKVIPGWEKGLVGACAGEKITLVVPPELAYGDKGAGGVIPPGATLRFIISLEVITRVVEAAPAKDPLGEVIVRDGKCRDVKTIKKEDEVTLVTQAKLLNGALLDESEDRIKVGGGQLLPGWEIGILGACQGERRRIMIGPNMAYGDRGVDRLVPPKATIVLDTLIKQVKRDEVLLFLRSLATGTFNNGR